MKAMRKTAAAGSLMLLVILVSWSAPVEERRPPASIRMEEYLKAFNSGSEEVMRAFILTQYDESALKEAALEQRLARYAANRERHRSFELVSILEERPLETFAVIRTGSGQEFLLRVLVGKEPPHKIQRIALEVVENPDRIFLPNPKADEQEFVSAVRNDLEARAQADEFSGVVLVALKDRVLFHEAYGFADREKKIPNRKDTKFNIGSINKTFTRIAVLQLAEKGRLALDDPIGKFLPDYPNAQAAAKVTIKHLLDMTSGIGDFFGPRFQKTPKETIRSIKDYLPLFADLPLAFEPGTNSLYSNGGYIVLGAIIEAVTGRDYYSHVRENIFIPCGMLDTDSYERDAAVSNRARGYTKQGGRGTFVLNQATLPGRGSSAGGGYSTAEDLLRFVRCLEAGKIRLPDSSGLGIAGGAPGINAYLEWDPRRKTVVIVLSNFDPPAAGDVARRIISWIPES